MTRSDLQVWSRRRRGLWSVKIMALSGVESEAVLHWKGETMQLGGRKIPVLSLEPPTQIIGAGPCSHIEPLKYLGSGES